jgi:D-alanine-D-alanine ligase
MSASKTAGEAGSPIGVCFGGPSPEHDVSVLTGLQAMHELARGPRRVTGLYWSKTGDWYEVDPEIEASYFVEGVPPQAQALRLVSCQGGGFVSERSGRGLMSGGGSRNKPVEVGVVVNCCHGGPGEDGSLQGAFDLAGLRYTGPGMAAATLGMDKLAFAAVADHAGLKVLPRSLLAASSTEKELGFPGPYIVKPRFGGSSIGVDVIADIETALARLRSSVHLQRGAVIEPFRADLFDLNIAVRSWPSLELSAVERPERVTMGSEILGYNDKYVGGEGMASAPRELPAKIPVPLLDRIRSVASQVSELIGVRGVTRIDFLSDGSEELWLNEANTIPGSLARYLWVDPPVPFSELLASLVDEAERSPASRHSAAGADGTVLRMAGSIATKLG